MTASLTDFVVIGDIYIINGTQSDEKLAAKPAENLHHQIKNISSFKNKLKNEVENAAQPGIIHRPTPGELLAKDEPEIKKQANSALKETLDQVPELQKAKEYLRSQKA